MIARAFTLVEVLCVTGILMLVAALAMPSLIAAKEGAKKGVCVSNLRQIHLATVMYQQEWDGNGNYGDVYAMGLPIFPVTKAIPELDKLRCPSAPHPIDSILSTHYFVYYTAPEKDGMIPRWADYSVRYGDAAVLYGDPFHNPPHISLMWGNHITRFCQGMTIGGTLVRRSRKGDWMFRTWWHDD